MELDPAGPPSNGEMEPPSRQATLPLPKTRRRGKVASTAENTSRPLVKALSPVKLPPSPPRIHDDDESSDDELLLSPPKKTSVRPSTPTRASGSRVGTPRVFLHSVEITTPRHLRNGTKRDLGSPAPRTSAHLPPLGTPRLPAAFPTVAASPGKRKPPSMLRRTTRTPSPPQLTSQIPLPTIPKSPSRTAQAPTARTPSKRQRSQAPTSPEKRHGLPEQFLPLFERQKRAVMRWLQEPPQLDEIELYGEDYPPTNTVAYEQLYELLVGTVDRGEGNSCMLIGPSGSGKTQV